MLIIRLSPGLANQMYQYASAYSLAKELGQELVLDISECVNSSRGYLLDYFRIPDSRKLIYPQVSIDAEAHLNCDSALQLLGSNLMILVQDDESKSRYMSEQRVLVYAGLDMTEELRKYDNLYMCGYFMNRNLYFKKYWNELMEFFVLREESVEVKHFKELIADKVSIGVHIRRGDMLLADFAIKMEDDYYRAAIQYCKEMFVDCIFCVFSDDIEYAKKILGKNESIRYIHFYGYNDAALNEFVCLSLCNHRILSNSSTFGRLADELNWGKERHVFMKYTGGIDIDVPLEQRSLEREIRLTKTDIQKYSSSYSINKFEDNVVTENLYARFLDLISENRNHEALQLAFCIYAKNRGNFEFISALSEVLMRTGLYEECMVELAQNEAEGYQFLQKIILDENRKNELKLLLGRLSKIHKKHFIIVLSEPAMPTNRTYGLIDFGIVLTHLGHTVVYIYEPKTNSDNYYLQKSARLFNKENIDMGAFHYSKKEVLSTGVAEFYNRLDADELYVISRDDRFFVESGTNKKLLFITTDLSDEKDEEIMSISELKNMESLYEKADLILTKDAELADQGKYVYWQSRGEEECFSFVEVQWKYGYNQRLSRRIIGMTEALCERMGEEQR